MTRAALPLVLLLASACTKEKPPPTPAPPADASAPAATTLEDGRPIVKGACLSCHSEEMLVQQRLTEAQWTKVVTKMVGWGANLDTKDTAPLIAWLAATCGPDAGAYEPQPIPVAEAPAELAPLPDDAFADGGAEHGHALYVDKCSGCHGPEARGGIGVNLVDRPLLYRAPEVAETIRKGRGKMTPIALTDAEIADVLAHLRTLKN